MKKLPRELSDVIVMLTSSYHVSVIRVGSHVVFVWIHWTDVRIHCTDNLIERKVYMLFHLSPERYTPFSDHIFPDQTLPGYPV